MSSETFPQSARRRASGVWAFRARAEAVAAGRFMQLARDLETVAAPAVVIDLAARASEEEQRHVDHCRDLVEWLGADPGESPVVPHFELPPQLLDRERTVLLQVVGTSCINETVSATVLSEMMRCTERGPVHDTIQLILKDEINHGRIGWAYLAHLGQKGSLDYVGPYLPMLLDAAIEDELFDTPDPDDPDEPTIALGTLPKIKRAALFCEAIEELVLPALQHFGVDTRLGESWIKSRRSVASQGIESPLTRS